MFRTARRTAALAIAASGVAVFAGVGVASAHIQTDPPAIEAGKPATLGFIVEHGCADANTTGLDIKLPDGVTTATAAEDGWQFAASDGVVHFTGGNQDAHTSRTFHISFTAPPTPGTVLFPTVQFCGETESDWLDVQAEGQPEPEHPAPAVLVTQGPPTSDQLVIAPEDDADNAVTGTGATSATTATGSAVTPTPAATTAKPTKSDSSSAGVIIGIVIGLAVVLAIGGTVVTLRRRRGGAAPPNGPGNTTA